MVIRKLPAGLEDILFGIGTEHQTRNGQLVIITKIDISHIPYSATQSTKAKLDWIDSKIAQFDNNTAALALKADKVVGAVGGNLAVLDSDGNLMDSGFPAVARGMDIISPAVADNIVIMTALGNSADSGYKISDLALVNHIHAISEVTGLQTALDGKSAVGHTHIIAEITGLQLELDGKAATIHTHAIADVTGLQLALDGKSAVGHVHAISDVTGLQTALDGKSDTTHNHNGVYELADATILKSASIGVTVQGYDVNTAKINVAQMFSKVQGSVQTAGANAINFAGTNVIRFTATAANITIGTMGTKKGQEFTVTVDSANNVTGWGTEFLFAPDYSAVTPTPPASMTGTMKFHMEIVEVNGVDGGTANKIHVSWAK